MTEMKVRIENLGPLRVASVCVVSAHPETDAWEILRSWAEPLGLLENQNKHPIFGFNSPGPIPGQAEYGYEFWLKIDAETTVQGDIKTKEFSGGRYAVATHRGFPNPQVWRQLWFWVQSSPYKWRRIHELERPLNPLAPESEMVFDLYLPIE